MVKCLKGSESRYIFYMNYSVRLPLKYTGFIENRYCHLTKRFTANDHGLDFSTGLQSVK